MHVGEELAALSGSWEGWQTQCVHWLVLLSLMPHLLLGRASCRHLDRKGDTELAAPRPSMAQAQEKMAVI